DAAGRSVCSGRLSVGSDRHRRADPFAAACARAPPRRPAIVARSPPRARRSGTRHQGSPPMNTTRHALHWTLAAAASLTLAACSHKAVESVATEEDVPVVVKPVQTVDVFETTVAATGVVTPESGADWTITAPESARIAELPKAEGDTVNVGDL